MSDLQQRSRKILFAVVTEFIATGDPVGSRTLARKYGLDLSAASIRSLALQGGPMSDEEVREFEASPYAREGARLRRWDDLAKVAGAKASGLPKYQSLLEKLSVKAT